MKRKHVFLLHCAIWAVWFLVNSSWALISRTSQPTIPLVYNMVTVIMVFYTTRWVASLYWYNVETHTRVWVVEDGTIEMRYPKKIGFYIWQWPLLGMIGVVLGYIGICWLVDGLFVQLGLLPGRYPDFYYYTFGKWASIDFYVCTGNIMAAIEYHIRKEKSHRFVLEEACRQVTEENKVLQNDVKTYLRLMDKRRKQREEGEDSSLL